MSKGKWLNNIGRIIKKKSGKGFFLIFERPKDKDKNYKGESPFPLTINEGDIFQLKAKKDDLQSLVDQGFMTEELRDKICEFVRFEVNRAPQEEAEEEEQEETPPAKKAAPAKGGAKKPKDEVDF